MYSSRLLVFLWASALIFSGLGTYFGGGNLWLTWPSLSMVCAGLLILTRPESKAALQISAVVYLLAFADQMPATPNHRCVLFFVALAIALKSLGGRSAGEIASSVIGTIRCLTIVVYGFATLAKMNTTYLDREISCASLFSSETFQIHGIPNFLGPEAGYSIALISLIVEGFIPILLIWPRTRVAGVCIGVAFHIFLSLNFIRYFGNFSSTMFLLLMSWLPEDSCKRAIGHLSSRSKAALKVWVASLIALTIFSITAVIGGVEYAIARHVLYLAFASSVLMAALTSLGATKYESGVGRPMPLILVLAIINASSPYIGLKTRAALSMYSNLRVEPGYSNHFFMPPSGDPFGYFSDTVEVLATDDARLQQRIQQTSSRMTYIALCAYLACQDELCDPRNHTGAISYSRGGAKIDWPLDGPIPSDCPNWLARKLLFFGPVGPSSELACVW